MADHFLMFSEIVSKLTTDEERWLKEQLEVVYVFDSKEFLKDDVPDDLDPDRAEFVGCRVFREWKEYDSGCGDGAGFCYEFHDDDDWGRHLWVYAEEGGDVDRVAYLVQKFLQRFRPKDFWSLTYSTTCSKPRVSEFDGGAVFVTAKRIKWQNAYGFVEREREAFEKRKKALA